MTDTLYSRATELFEAEVDDEIVALDHKQGEVYGFNTVASDVWRLLEEPRSLGELCFELEQLYDVDRAVCAAETAALLDQLLEMKLVRRISA